MFQMDHVFNHNDLNFKFSLNEGQDKLAFEVCEAGNDQAEIFFKTFFSQKQGSFSN